jgi:hypothetical protein
MFIPFYMVMFPFLVIVAYYQRGTHAHLNAPNSVVMAAAVQLLPGWMRRRRGGRFTRRPAGAGRHQPRHWSRWRRATRSAMCRSKSSAA